MAAKIKKGDKVVVLTGRDKGRTGEVLEVRPAENRALVRGVNMVKRHQRQAAGREGGIISKEAAIHISNLAFADSKDGKPTRIGFKFVGEGNTRRKVRFSKRTGDEIDGFAPHCCIHPRVPVRRHGLRLAQLARFPAHSRRGWIELRQCDAVSQSCG